MDLPEAEAFDWRTQTYRKGTVSRIGRYVRGDCARPDCGETEALLYAADDDDTLLCVWHSRERAAGKKRQETCDNGDGKPAWRDPLTGRNEFYCAECHAANGTVFQNRWAVKAREGRVLGIHDKAVCELAEYGTECKGEVKWRGSLELLACNKHAGRTSANEANN